MKTVQTFLLCILLIAVGPYPQDISATGIDLESPGTRTDTIKLEGLTTVAPNEEIQHEEKVTTTTLELQNTVIILQLPIENNVPLKNSPNDSVQPTIPTTTTPNTALNSETKSETVDGAVTTSETESIVHVPESISTSEIAALPTLPASSPESHSATELKSTTGDPESKLVTEISSSSTKLISATTDAAPKVVEPKNTAPSSFQSLSTSAQSKSTSGIPEYRSSLGTNSGFHELVSETQDATQTHFDSDNTSSIPSESSSASDSASESLLSTIAHSAESISASTAAKTGTTSSPTQPSEGSAAVQSTFCHSNCEGSLDPLEGAQSATTPNSDKEIQEISSTSTGQNIESDLQEAGNSSGTEESFATKEIKVDSTPAVPESATQSRTVSRDDADDAPVSSSITETNGAFEATGTETPVRASKADTLDAAENIKTSTVPSQTPSPTASPSTDPSTSESIPASIETTQSPPYTDNTSSTPSETRSTSESAPEIPSAVPEITSEAPPPVPCTETGNFPSPANCLTYISCSGNVTDLLRQELVCPERSAFSPVFRRCTRDISPCNDGPSCLYPGSIADPTNSSSYYWCVPSLLGGFHKYHIQCSVDESFNALFGRCLLQTPTYGLNNPSFGIPNDRDIAKAESKRMKKELKAKAKEEKIRLKMEAKAKADAAKLALKQQ